MRRFVRDNSLSLFFLALFVLALCSFAVMGGFLWVLTRRHRKAEQQRQLQSPPEADGPGERLG